MKGFFIYVNIFIFFDQEGGIMKLLTELKFCMEALEVLKKHYLSKSMNDCQDNTRISDLYAGQYIAYASCYSVLMELIEKYKNV